MKKLIPFFFSSCVTTSHPVVPADLGRNVGSAAMEESLATPGPINLETVVAADWQVPLSGLLNLDRVGLKDRDEPIQIFVHVIHHPTRGTFIVDGGVTRDQRDVPDLVRRVLHTEKQRVRESTEELARRLGRVDGVLLTHVHFDHVMGLQGLPKTTPIYVGRGDTADRSLRNLVLHGMFDDFFAGFGPIRELHYERDVDGRFAGVIDHRSLRRRFALGRFIHRGIRRGAPSISRAPPPARCC